MRRSQLRAIYYCAKRLNIGASSFIRSSSMRRAYQETPESDPRVSVVLWVTEKEKKTIDSAAKRAHTTPSSFMRDGSVSAVADLIAKSSGAIAGLGANQAAWGYQPESRPGPGPAPAQHRSIGEVR